MRMLVGLTIVAFSLTAQAFEISVKDYGAIGDGETDNTAAFQAALDTAAEAGGGIVKVPTGQYRFDGTLAIPGGVTLQGTFLVPPTDQREGRVNLDGSVLKPYAGRGDPDGEPFIRLAGSMATLAGFMITYPEWSLDDVPPVPYPPTVYAGGPEPQYTVANVAVLDTCFLNSYEAIKFEHAGRHFVRNVMGYPSKRGLYVDGCYDIGRVENVHFWPFGTHYDIDNRYSNWVNQNGVAFEFARTDWQYVFNTFCFGYGVGYKFSESEHGSCNGSFIGIGADSCHRAVLVEQAQNPAILITNGEFVGAWGTDDSITIEITESATDGKVSLKNCAFWGPIERAVWNRSDKTQFTSIGSYIQSWDTGATGAPAIHLDGKAKAILQGNTFGVGHTHVRVESDVTSAIILGNQAEGGMHIDNQAGNRTQMGFNEQHPVDWDAVGDDTRAHYRVDIGVPNDRPYVIGWNGLEPALEWPGDEGTKRWSSRNSRLKLPVLPDRDYIITADVYIPSFAMEPDMGLVVEGELVAPFPQEEGVHTVTGELPATGLDTITMEVRCNAWQPKEEGLGNDIRWLGVAVRSITLQAVDTDAPLFDACKGE